MARSSGQMTSAQAEHQLSRDLTRLRKNIVAACFPWIGIQGYRQVSTIKVATFGDRRSTGILVQLTYLQPLALSLALAVRCKTMIKLDVVNRCYRIVFGPVPTWSLYWA